MDGDVVASLQQFVQINELDANLSRIFIRNERIAAYDVHLEACGTLSDFSPNLAEPAHTKRLAIELDPDEFASLPLAEA